MDIYVHTHIYVSHILNLQVNLEKKMCFFLDYCMFVLNLSKGTIVKRSTGWRMVSISETEIEKFTTHCFWRKYPAYLKGPQKRSDLCEKRERSRPLGYVGGVFGIPGLRPDWSIKSKRAGLESHRGSYH